MSTRHELLGKIVTSDRVIEAKTAGPLPCRPCGRAASGTGNLGSVLPSGIYPEPLGKIIPSKSGPLPMTAGRFPV
jgi:hypothetical protein